MRWYQDITNEQSIAAVYEERMDWDHDLSTCTYEAWAVTGYGVERVYIAKDTLEKCCVTTSEEEAEKVAPALIETLRVARPDTIRPAKASPHYTCEHGEGCMVAEHSQDQLWREAQQVSS